MRRNLSWLSAIALLFACSACMAATLKTGDTPPNVTLGTDIDGNAVKLADYPGNVIVISFWASWCAPCRQELPILDSLEKAAQQKKLPLQVIAVNIEDRDTFRRVARKLGDTVHLKLVNERNGRSAAAYGVKPIPHMVIIDRDGRILNVHVGYGERSLDDILAEINRALAAGSTVPSNDG